MNEMSFEQFEMNVESAMKEAASGDRFTTVQMSTGKAVIISQEEWDMLRQAFAVLVGGKVR